MTTTSEEYATCFGFTETEVFDALAEYQLTDQKEMVKNGMMDLPSARIKISIIRGRSLIFWTKTVSSVLGINKF